MEKVETALLETSPSPSGERVERVQGNKHRLHFSAVPDLCKSTPVQLGLLWKLALFLLYTIKLWLLLTKKMNNSQPPDGVGPNKDQEEEGNGMDWLLGKDSPEINHVPMDTNIVLSR